MARSPKPESPEGGAAPVIIKKYANRRLYDTDSSSYITLDHLSAMTRAGREFKVVDAKTGDDITHNVLTQIIMEEESRGTTMLPVPFLRQLIAMYGDQMQAMVPHYLEASMESFRRNQEQFRTALSGMMESSQNPFEAVARQNMAMMKAAADMWGHAASGPPENKAERRPEPQSPPPAADEMQALKTQLAELQAKIDRMVKD